MRGLFYWRIKSSMYARTLNADPRNSAIFYNSETFGNYFFSKVINVPSE